MIPFQLLLLKNVSIYEQLQLEEALLRADSRNWCLINTGSAPAIVLGISGRPNLLIDQEMLAERSVPLIRRFSGGGTVFVDHHTFFVTWICNAEQVDVKCCPQKIHRWTAAFYQAALPALGLTLKDNDYVIAERKFGGNAQYLCKDRWLHHSSLLWDYDADNMKYLLMPQKTPAYRQGRLHVDFLCRLCDYLPEKQVLEKMIVDELNRRFSVEEIDVDEAWKITRREHRKGTQYI